MTKGRTPGIDPLWVANLVSWILAGAYFATGHGRTDSLGGALGRDFSNLWTAGRLVVEGRIAEVFQPELFGAAQHQLVDPGLSFQFWSYPPPALFLAAPLGHLDYGWALAAWSLFGLLALAGALRLAFPLADRWLLLLSPAVACNLIMGQNGALTGALLIASLALLPRRPLISGVLMGLLVFKPQVALMLPMIVIAAGRWRTLLAAAATIAVVIVLSALVFGLDAWRGFLGPTLTTQAAMMSGGQGGFLLMMTSAFGAGRLFRLHGTALILQVPFALLAGVLAWRAYRAPPSEGQTAVGLLAGLTASPQGFNYDMVPAMGSALFLARHTPSRTFRLVAILVWISPFLMVVLNMLKLPATPLLLAVSLAAIYDLRRRA